MRLTACRDEQVGVCVPAGRLQAADMLEMAEMTDKYSGGEVRVTCEENLVFPNVKNSDVEAMSKEPFFQRFEINAGNLMGSLVSCTGSQFCGFAMIETKNRCAPPADLVDDLDDLPIDLLIDRVSGLANLRQCDRTALHQVSNVPTDW